MKMTQGSGAITNYQSYSKNYTAKQYPYKIPVNSLADVQLYIDIGVTGPGTVQYELIHTCGATAGMIETITPGAYVVGQDTNDNYFGVFREFTGSTAMCFVIAITLDAQIYFSEEYEISCNNLTLIKGCYGNLDPKISYDCEGIYFGVSQGGTMGDATVVYKHEMLLKNVEVFLSAFKNTFKQGRTRNFRTESETIYLFTAYPVPEWYIRDVNAVFRRGEVFIDGVKWLVSDTPYEKIDICLKTWIPNVNLKETCYQSYSCELDPCAQPVIESGESGEECCDPVVLSAFVQTIEGGGN